MLAVLSRYEQPPLKVLKALAASSQGIPAAALAAGLAVLSALALAARAAHRAAFDSVAPSPPAPPPSPPPSPPAAAASARATLVTLASCGVDLPAVPPDGASASND